MKEIIVIGAIGFLSYWVFSLNTISEPSPLYINAPYGEAVAILPIRKDSCQVQILDGEVVYVKNLKWVWCLNKTKLKKHKEEIGYVTIDGKLYFFTENFYNLKNLQNVSALRKSEFGRVLYEQ